MRILHVTNAYPYTEYISFGIFIKDQINSLENLDIKNKVFFLNAHKFGPKQYFKSITQLKKKIDEFQPDIIHCHHEFSLIPILFIKNSRPIILSLLGDISKRSFINRFFFRSLKNMANAIIIKSNPTYNLHYNYIPNGVNMQLFRPIDKACAKKSLNLEIDKKYILFVTASLNNPIKRYDKFLNVIYRLREDLNEPLEPLILSGVSREKVPLYFNASSIMLLTSDHEGSPNAIKEAMACNIPVVSTNVGNVKSMFGDAAGCFVSEDNSEDDLVELSKKAITFTESEGRNRIVELELDLKSVAIKVSSIYSDLI